MKEELLFGRSQISSALQEYAGPIDDMSFEGADGFEVYEKLRRRSFGTDGTRYSDYTRRFQLEKSLLSGLLEPLVEEQMHAIASGTEQPFASNDPNELFSHYKTTQTYADVIDELSELAYYNQVVDYKYLVGRVFTDIAASFLSARLSKGNVLLSSGGTLRLYEKMYPDAKRKREQFGLDSLEGISVPNGLIVQQKDTELLVRKTVEYTILQNEDMRGKITNARKSREFTGIFHPQLNIQIVVPSPSVGEEPFENPPARSDIVVLPFDRREYRLLIDSLKLDA